MLVKYFTNASPEIKNLRKSASKKLKTIAEEQRGFCAYCGKKMRMDLIGVNCNHKLKPTIEHILNVEDGGRNNRENLCAVHRGCNDALCRAKHKKEQGLRSICLCTRCGSLNREPGSNHCIQCNKHDKMKRLVGYYTRLFWTWEQINEYRIRRKAWATCT